MDVRIRIYFTWLPSTDLLLLPHSTSEKYVKEWSKDGDKSQDFFNFHASNLPNWYFFSLHIVGVELALAWEGKILKLESEDKLQPVSQ